MSAIFLIQSDRDLLSRPQYWTVCPGPVPFLPMSRDEVGQLNWDGCDIILVTGDAYVDHPSFDIAICGRILEAQGFRVGIIARPEWNNKDNFMRLGKPNPFFSVTVDNVDSMINRYIADRRLRHDDAYAPNNAASKRPDRAAPVYTQCYREAWKDVPVILGSIEANLCHTAHYDYWSDTVRRSVLVDSRADMLMFGNDERPLVGAARRLAMGGTIDQICDVHSTAITVREALPGWNGVDSTRLDTPGRIGLILHPYGEDLPCTDNKPVAPKRQEAKAVAVQPPHPRPWEETYMLLPSFEKVKGDKVLYTHAPHVLYHEANPGYAYALMQKHGDRYIRVNPPTIPLFTKETDSVFALPYKRVPYPAYGDSCIPACKMIHFSINTMRDYFGGCSFCSITEHEGRITQNRSGDSIINEIKAIRDTVPGFTGMISDLGGPAASMYMLRCRSPCAEQICRRLSYVHPDICPRMDTNHKPTINLCRRTYDLKGTKGILIASGVRYGIAVEDPHYIEKLATHRVGGYLKTAPEHTEEGPLSKMMKSGMDSYDRFRELFDTYFERAGKEQYLIPYFISAHPGTRNEDMVNLALRLKQRRFRLGQVQNFYPSSLVNSTTMYYTGKSPLGKIGCKSGDVVVPKGDRQRRLHKALLRYHDPTNWPLIRQVLGDMDKKHLISSRRGCLAPAPTLEKVHGTRRQNRHARLALTKHTPVAHQRQTPAASKKRGEMAGR